MPLSLKVAKQNIKWENATNFPQDIKSPRRIVASPHRFKTQISKIVNTRETQHRSTISHRRSFNGNPISKSRSVGEIGCLECKSNRGTKRSSNSQRTKSIEFSSNDNNLRSNLLNRKRIFLDPKTELAHSRSSIKKEDIKQRLEQLRKNTKRLIRKSIQRKMIQEGNIDKTSKTSKYYSLDGTFQQKLDRSLKELNTPQLKTQNIQLLIDSSINQKQDISPICPLKSIEKTQFLNNTTKNQLTSEGFKKDKDSIVDSRISAETLNFKKQSRRTNSLDSLHSNTENENCLSGCCPLLDTLSRTSPLLQNQSQNINLISKREDEVLSYCNIETVSCGKECQCLKDKCNEKMSSLSLEMPPSYLRMTTVNNCGSNQKNPTDAYETQSRITDVRKREMPFWLRPSPIHIYPYNFVLAVRRKLEYIVNPPLSKMESTENIKPMPEETSKLLKHNKLMTNVTNLNTANSFESDGLFISGAERKLHNLNDSISSNRLGSCVTSSSSKMCVLNEVHTPIINHQTEPNGDEFQGDDTTISSSVFDSPKTLDSTLCFAENNMILRSISPLPVVNIEQTEKTFNADNNLNQLLDDFNHSLSQAMKVNEQIKNKTLLSCTSRDDNVGHLLMNDARLTDYLDSSRSTLSHLLKDYNGCANIDNFNSESSPNRYKSITTTNHTSLQNVEVPKCTLEGSKIKKKLFNNNPDYLTQVEPIIVSPLNLPNLRLTDLNDEYQKLLHEMETSSSVEHDSKQSEYNSSSLIMNISQQSQAKDHNRTISSCEYSNEVDNKMSLTRHPACLENLETVHKSPVTKENIVKKESINTTLNIESFIKTESNGRSVYMVTKSSKSQLKSKSNNLANHQKETSYSLSHIYSRITPVDEENKKSQENRKINYQSSGRPTKTKQCTLKEVVYTDKVNRICESNSKMQSKSETSSHLAPPEQTETVSIFSQSEFDRPLLSPLTLSPNPPSVSSRSTLKTETMPTDHFKNLIQMGEKILLDRTKSQIAWLEVLKDHYKENGLVTHIATVKKKQRGLLLKLDQEREKIKRLLYSTRPTLKPNMPAGNKSSKHSSTESRSKPFSIEAKNINRTKAIFSMTDNLLTQRELDLHKKREQPEDLINYQQRINGDKTEVLKLVQTLNSSNKQMQKLDHLLWPDGIVRKGKVEDHFKDIGGSLLKKGNLANCATGCRSTGEKSPKDFSLQRFTSPQMKKLEPNRDCNLCKTDSQPAVTLDFARQCNKCISKDIIHKSTESQMNNNIPFLLPVIAREMENKNEIEEGSDQCNDSADESSFNINQSGDCLCAFEMDFREGPSSGTDTESLFSARQELLERNKLIERNVTKLVLMTKEIIAQHAGLRRSLSDNQIHHENIHVRSDYCKTWPNSRKSTCFKRFSGNAVSYSPNKYKNIGPNLVKSNLIDVKQINEKDVNSSHSSSPSSLLHMSNSETAFDHISKSDFSGKSQLAKESEIGTKTNKSFDTSSNSSYDISKPKHAPLYYKSTACNIESDCKLKMLLLSKQCQNEKVGKNLSTFQPKTLTKKVPIPTGLSESSKDYLQECKSITEPQMRPADEFMSHGGTSFENASEELPLCLELRDKKEHSELMANQALTKAISQLKPEIIENVKDRRFLQSLRESERQINNNAYGETYIREIPNKPPPPYVSPAPGSPMTTIFPSEERIRDITFRRSHELFCQLLKMDYTSSKGEKLPSVMEERITNIYERIILDICQEYLNDHMDVVSQGNPADFHGQLAFFNPPDRLSCIQNAIYKEVHRCLAMNKCSPKRHQVFSIYGQRAKRDHIGKIIIQEIYDEDDQWCNFQREENEVLELMVGEMITHQMFKLSNEEWFD